MNFAAAQSSTFGRARDDIAGFKANLRAEMLKAREVQINRTRADGATAGQRGARLAEPRKQRPQRGHGGANRLDQLIRRFKEFDVRGGRLVRSQFRLQHGRTDVFEKTALRDDVAHVRQVVQRDCFRGEQGRSHARQRGIFCAANRDPPAQGASAGDSEFIHAR